MLRVRTSARAASFVTLLAVVLSLAPSGALSSIGVMAAPAHAAAGRCAEGTGVTVVVDYGPLGGGTQVGCAPDGAGQSGAQVVAAAGFPLTFVSGEPFVCRIAGRPAPGDEDCSGTPPADAYWGLFWSDGTPATWAYATLGITGLQVPEGGSIGWRWQDGGGRDLPGAAPTAAPSGGPSDGPSDGPSGDPSDGPSGDPTGGQGGQGGQGEGQGDGTSIPATTPAATPSAPGSNPGSAPADAPGSGTARQGTAEPSGHAESSPRTPRSSKPTAERPDPRRTAGDAERDRTAAAGGGGATPTAEGDSETRALEPVSGDPADGADGGSPVMPWLAAAVLLALAAGALVLARRRRTGA